ncbi:two-component sensor histidine kinase, partial [bacterium]|nr:two-component sensor histidine kinase [bacterium]
MNPGKLTIFLGMAPGVGKTYAMLQAGQEQLRQGVDVLIGYVETHRRVETEALARSLPILPRKIIDYQGRTFEELDLSAVLDRQPKIVLVDELAHTNIPGSIHEKRWQDVDAILESGIDVYTTLNIQHVESRSEEVQSLAGIPIHETVPDLMLERAAEVRLVDLSPADLLQRLREGKVYLPHKIEQAASHFFEPETLSALREMVLRFTAEKVDTDLHRSAAFQTKKKIWNLNERFIVAVSHSPYSKVLIRTARRLAFSLGAPWIAVYVNQGLSLTNQEREQLSQNLELAKNLGADVITTADSDLMAAIKRVSVERNVTKIVTGRSLSVWWNRFVPSLSQRFVTELPHLDVYV